MRGIPFNETYAKYCWGRMLDLIGNEIGTAALLGNWVRESYMLPFIVQGDTLNNYSYSVDYTAKVDAGTITREQFTRNAPRGGGYGLAQWTYYTRKEGLYDLHISTGYSIGSAWLGCEYAKQELQSGYTSTLTELQNATDLYTTVGYVMRNYEQPADQSAAAQQRRYLSAQDIYELCHGIPPDPTPPDPDPPTPPVYKAKKMPLWMYLKRR